MALLDDLAMKALKISHDLPPWRRTKCIIRWKLLAKIIAIK
jgi:hypothetical protein